MLRPIVNVTLGHVATDAVIAHDLVSAGLDLDINLVNGGEMDVYGFGGALMLDYERYREDHELDVELHYTNIGSKTFGSTTEWLRGESRSGQVDMDALPGAHWIDVP